MTRHLAAAAVLAALSAPAAAAPLDRYSSFLVLGDSLSDPGNLPQPVADANAPNPPYARVPADADVPGGAGAKFANGDVWADLIGEIIPNTANVAFGGAAATAQRPIDLDAQLGLSAVLTGGSAPGADDLGAVWIGANDLFAALGALDPGTATEADARAALGAAVAGIAAAVDGALGALAARGYETLALFNLPGFENIPLYTLVDPARNGFARIATELYNDAVAGIAAARGDTRLVDVADAFETILDAQPGGFDVAGTPFTLSEAVQPCFFAPAGPVCTDPNDRVFFDAVHPSAATHVAVANTFTAALAPIPLPAGLPLLALGLGALGLAARRGR